mmetsp:Transcript_53459/g.59704  ORF Transcript_53459/g.59704 Transcript_53459/m.59704 type:complete len:283 (+) Transcript_53459:337-1185(+)|eukprot:CAMPEP_0170903718 /NCGR_PEP_ID=MMETSP0734-20130129/49952_1 /TAXON_ID=186038 /ORGANISM="Fragilariopsis kerguelensis, Strain L26-C5" /LENGTH=282 /DNA_ID=CAMNT_0011298995 /DNA_START=287 /DNA_END=1135 /DNA_ORIENTATION=+
MRETISKGIEGQERHPNLKEPKSSDDLKGFEEYWTPLFQVMVDSALEAAKTNDKVVITFASAFKIQRDFVMNKLKEGGAKHVTLLYLDMNEDKKIEGLYHRSVIQARAAGVSLVDWVRVLGYDGDGDDLSMDEFKSFMYNGGKLNMTLFDSPPSYAAVVDVTGRDVTAIDGVDAVLGLQRSGEESYDEIVKKVVARDHKRDAETPYSIELFPEINAEVAEALANAKSEEEKKQIKRRASSLIGMELMMNRLSITSTSSGTSNMSDKVRGMRRSSLIKTGKIK